MVKADGLCAGKGVVVPNSTEEVKQAVREAMVERRFGKAGEKIVIQEKVEGREVSVISLSDGKYFRLLPPAMNYKRLLDNDEGSNTGGMGAISDKNLLSEEQRREISLMHKTIITAMREEEGFPYVGFLYLGIMLTDKEPLVLEVNVRLGDPAEAQVVLPLINSDLIELSLAATGGVLKGIDVGKEKGSSWGGFGSRRLSAVSQNRRRNLWT